MIVSRYTLVERYENLILLYNSLSGKFAALDWDKKLYEQLLNCSDNMFVPTERNDTLLNNGFLVEDHQAELKMANLKKYDFIYENTLKLEIIPTLFCNFDCPYCYERHNSYFMKDETKESIKKFIVKNISQYSAIQLFWFGGEPLLVKDYVIDLSSFVKRIAKGNNKKYAISITTNGYLLDECTFAQLYASGVRRYQVTFDGSSTYHDKKRFLKNGSGSYETILKNLVNIKNKKGFFNFNIRCNITKENCNDIKSFLETMNSHFKNDYRFKFYFRPVGDWGGDKVKTITDQLLNNNYAIYDKLSDLNEKNLDYSMQFLWLGNIGICESNQRNYYVINPFGEVLKCTKHLDNPNNKVGYISNHGDLIVNKHILSNWIVNSIKERTQCVSCKSYASCFGVQCPISNRKDCEYSEISAQKFLRLRYQCSPDDFVKI